ncbi:MAG: zinc ABC transporter substrate-binding protein [Desulfobulbaceae bacterium]
MTDKKFPYVPIILAILCALVPGAPGTGRAADTPVRVAVSILPQSYFVGKIGGERVKVDTLVQPGRSPATYGLTPRQMTELGKAAVYFRIGVPFENGLIPRLRDSFPGLPIVDLREGITLLSMEDDGEEDHEHGELDQHTWLDPLLALQQAERIRDELIRIDPEGKEIFRRNFAALAGELRSLDRELRGILAPYAGRAVYVFHPAYGYFCRAYGLRQHPIHVAGKDPGGATLARFITEAKQDRVRAIFVQPQFSDRAARTIARSINAEVVPLDPLAADYPDNLRTIARRLARYLAPAGQTTP